MIKVIGKIIRRCLNACEFSEEYKSKSIIDRIITGEGNWGQC